MAKISKRTQELVEEMLQVVIADMATLGYELGEKRTISPKIKWMRSWRTLGSCTSFIQNNLLLGTRQINSEIKLSEYLVNGHNDKQLVAVLYHEVAHAFAPKDGHGGVFADITALLHKERGIKISSYLIDPVKDDDGNVIEPKKFKYAAVCKRCGEIVGLWKNKSKTIKDISRYSHTGCHGKLDAFEIRGDGVWNEDELKSNLGLLKKL